MNPARAMGTFLQTWRSEWAGLSRAQLAIAISAHLTGRKAVTPRMVLRWEAGHPPNSSEELEALCRVMRRHALLQPEVEQFRQAVFAACLDRQYPEVFRGEGLAERPDISEAAEALYAQMLSGSGAPGVVYLVAAIRELSERAADPFTRRGTGNDARRQQVALAYLMAVLALHQGTAGRRPLKVAMLGRCADFLEDHLGVAGLGNGLTVLRLRALAAFRTAHGWSGVCGARQIPWARRLLDFHDQAVAAGHWDDAAAVLRLAIDAVGELEPGAYSEMLPEALRYRDRPYQPPPPGPLEGGLAWAAMAEGEMDAAERFWDDLFEQQPENPIEDGKLRGWIALQRTDYDEAERQFARSLEALRSAGHPVPKTGSCELQLCAWARKTGQRVSFREQRLGHRWF